MFHVFVNFNKRADSHEMTLSRDKWTGICADLYTRLKPGDFIYHYRNFYEAN